MSEKADKQVSSPEIKKLRFTLSSPSSKRLESFCNVIVTRFREQNYAPRGPVRLPTKVLTVTTRKTPNGEGSKTWDTYEMRVHKRIIVVYAKPADIIKLSTFKLDPKIHLLVTVANE